MKGIIYLFVGAVIFAFPSLTQVSPYYDLKGFMATADWAGEGVGYPNPMGLYVIYLAGIVGFGATIFLFIANIISDVPAVTNSPKRWMINFVVLLISLGLVYGLAMSHNPAAVQGSGKLILAGAPSSALSLYPQNVSFDFDTGKNLNVYEVAFNAGKQQREITGIAGKTASGTRRIAPPFGDNIEVVGGQKTADKIIIEANKAATIKVSTNQTLWIFSITEAGNKKWQMSFWK